MFWSDLYLANIIESRLWGAVIHFYFGADLILVISEQAFFT